MTQTISNLTTKIISGQKRKTRLHDEKGNLISLSKLLKHGPLSLVSGILRLTIDYRPELPWISYEAIGVLREFLSKESRVLEFGSGMSTIWYAKYAGEVCSVEDYRTWYDKVSKVLEKKQLDNVNYHFAENHQEYKTFMASDSDGFDLIMIDGKVRCECVKNAIKLLRSGGILYLDNSDKYSSVGIGDIRLAEKYALEFAHKVGAKITYFTDLAPTQFFVQQGLMIKVP
ncbi:class I SAM-dependent methyltransferase [Leptothoe sp. EHU-05/26/07-4]